METDPRMQDVYLEGISRSNTADRLRQELDRLLRDGQLTDQDYYHYLGKIIMHEDMPHNYSLPRKIRPSFDRKSEYSKQFRKINPESSFNETKRPQSYNWEYPRSPDFVSFRDLTEYQMYGSKDYDRKKKEYERKAIKAYRDLADEIRGVGGKSANHENAVRILKERFQEAQRELNRVTGRQIGFPTLPPELLEAQDRYKRSAYKDKFQKEVDADSIPSIRARIRGEKAPDQTFESKVKEEQGQYDKGILGNLNKKYGYIGRLNRGRHVRLKPPKNPENNTPPSTPKYSYDDYLKEFNSKMEDFRDGIISKNSFNDITRDLYNKYLRENGG